MLLAFAAALVTTMLAGAIAYFVFKHFASKKAASIGAFWLMVGAAAVRYSYSGPLNDEAALAFSALLGAGLAVFLLWRWLLRKPADSATDRDF